VPRKPAPAKQPELTSAELDDELTAARIVKLEKEIQLLELQLNSAQHESETESAELNRRRVFHFSSPVNQNAYATTVWELSTWAKLSKDPITIVINSPGGYVTYGLAIYDFLRGLSAEGIEIRTVGIGEVASMGGILFEAGDRRILTPNAWMLIHEVSSGSMGKSSEMDEALKFVKRLQDQCLDILSKRSTLSKAAIAKRWKKTDWWLTPDEAVELGFADEVRTGWNL
jgi:ATP-dependent Clp endopeptidase proteolytic subunit ClpP